jgi:neutral amino acid transport system permease protein
VLRWLSDSFSSLPRGSRRAAIASLLLFDATILGLLNGQGALNQFDRLLGGGMPNDLVWLLQFVEAVSAGFAFIKILFDDVRPGIIRNAAITLSPLFLLLVVFLSLEFLFQGIESRPSPHLESSATITLDLVSIGTNTLIHSSTFLAIAIGLTLTYKVQRYGNFAQSELFMIGMFFPMVMAWSEYYYPIYGAPRDGVIVWSLLLWTLVVAFIGTGIVGVMIDLLVYRGFRLRKATPQVMMIASLGVALILRAIYYLRFSSAKVVFNPDVDLRMPTMRWGIPTTKLRLNLGNRSLEEGRTYTQNTCEQTGIDEVTGEPVLSRIVNEGSKPAVEIWDVTSDCITHATTNYPFYKGVVPVVIFGSVALLYLLLTKTRLGRRMRAVADNPDLSASSGINVEMVQMTSAFLSAGISGLGGSVFALTLLYNPGTGFILLLPSFAVIVLGTIGSIPGAIVASLMMGFVTALSSPILIGIGMPLDRSNYTAMDKMMPYMFLVAILMIMPEGIGDSWEKWKIDRIRKRESSASESSRVTAAALAILPTGILGLHHWWRNRSDRAQTFSAIAIGAYVFHRISDFIGTQSFAVGACADSCVGSPTAETNLELLTGRDDGTLLVEDSPYFSEAVTDLDATWFDLMQTEIQLVNLIVDLGDIIWPWVPLLLWTFAVVEGINILRDGAVSESVSRMTNSLIPSMSAESLYSGPLDSIRATWSVIDRKHAEVVRNLSDQVKSSAGSIKSGIASWMESQDWRPSWMESQDWRLSERMPYGREGREGSWAAFGIILLILLLFLWWLPISDETGAFNWFKSLQVSNVVVVLSIFILMSFSLNLHTGVTGMVNFGVIFFVAVGAVTVGVLTSPVYSNGYGWSIPSATIAAILLSAAFGWALAYPTARLRMDYFAIVTISLGEILRVLLAGEPLLSTAPPTVGIGNYPLPLKQWWFCGSGVEIGAGTPYISADSCRDQPRLSSAATSVSDLLNLGSEPAPYFILLAAMGMICVFLVWLLLELLLASPWGRILKAIREDEEVAQHHGHNVLTHKAASLALGAAIAALAGAIWAWKLTGFEPTFMSPAKSTFLVWAAFIIGGTANNRGMVVGAFIIVLMDFVFNVLIAASSPDLPLFTTAGRIDHLFEWLVTDQWGVVKAFLAIAAIGLAIRSRIISDTGLCGALVFAFTAVMMSGEKSISAATNLTGDVSIIGASMAYVKVMLVGCLMLYSLKYNPKGLLPEVPSRPSRPAGGDSE